MNKPVAFIDCFSGKPKLIDGYVIQTEYDIPLYTHPVKELTDEEANDCYKEAWKLADDATGNCRSYTHMFQLLFNREFAKAILRKAQEK